MIPNVIPARVSGYAMLKNADENMGRVIEALRNSRDNGFLINVTNEEQEIPLHRYLVGVKPITESDSFCTGAPTFDIYKNLPLGLTQCREENNEILKRMGFEPVGEEEGRRMLDDFDFYTWKNEPGRFNEYLSVLRKANSILDQDRICNGDIKSSLDKLLQFPEAETTDSGRRLSELVDGIRTIERQVGNIPKGGILDSFHKNGKIKLAHIKDLEETLGPQYKSAVGEVTGPLDKFGHEYREIYASKHAPERLQRVLPLS